MCVCGVVWVFFTYVWCDGGVLHVCVAQCSSLVKISVFLNIYLFVILKTFKITSSSFLK